MCADTETNISVINRKWLITQLSTCQIEHKMKPVFIKGVYQQSKEHAEFAYFDIYIPKVIPDGTKKVTKLRRGARVIDNLPANILIAINIILPDGIFILVSRNKLLIEEYKRIIIDYYLTPRVARVSRIV
jgi:hypothetical protein